MTLLARIDAAAGAPGRAVQGWSAALEMFTAMGSAEAGAVRELLAQTSVRSPGTA